MSWSECSDPIKWSELFLKNESKTYLASWQWGEYKKSQNDSLFRFVYTVDDTAPLMIQCSLKKTAPFVALIWIIGGPVGDLSYFNRDELISFFQSYFKKKLIYIRFSSQEYLSDNNVQNLLNNSWKNIGDINVPRQSMTLDLLLPIEKLNVGLTSNWRHNLKRFYKKGIDCTPWSEPDFKMVRELYAEMESQKGLHIQFSYDDLQELYKVFSQNLTLLVCKDEENKLIALRAAVIINGEAWDFWAASGLKARKLYSTYGLLWKLLEECKTKGVRRFNLAGIDKINNPGVYNFKKGTGAHEITYLGDWEATNFSPLSILVNKFIKV